MPEFGYENFMPQSSFPAIINPNMDTGFTLRYWQRICAMLVCCFAFSDAGALSAENNQRAPISRELSLDAETDLNLNIYPATGRFRILWIPAYTTPVDTVTSVADQLNHLNIEVWHADIPEARFLPKTASSIYKIKEKDIIAIINAAKQDGDKKLFIFAESRAAIPVLLALRKMQQSVKTLPKFGGLIFNAPYFYVETPDPGKKAQLMPVVSATNLPVYVIQPKNSPRYWQLAESIPALENSGSDVFVQVLPHIRGRFLYRPDATAEEEALAQQFGQMIVKAIKHLETVNHKNRIPAQQNVVAIRNAGGKKDHILASYNGNPIPPPLSLNSLSGRTVNLMNFPNKVILVNFWTTWCPPCVKEMPSLQRLSEKLPQDRFVILGVNIAEGRKVIENFVSTKIKIDFPVLLDIDGNVMRQWNVMAFPTTFVIDKNGKIRYALFGSIEWDTIEIRKKIQALVDE